MTLTVYGIKNCDSMKKAFQWLDAQGIAYEFVDFKKTPPTRDQVATWLSLVGDALVNTRGPSYRQLPEDLRANFSGDTRINAIVDKPTLIKRPLMVRGSTATVGYQPEAWKELPHLLTEQ